MKGDVVGGGKGGKVARGARGGVSWENAHVAVVGQGGVGRVRSHNNTPAINIAPPNLLAVIKGREDPVPGEGYWTP